MKKNRYDTHHYTIPATAHRRDILPSPYRCIGERVHSTSVEDDNYDGQVVKTMVRPTKFNPGDRSRHLTTVDMNFHENHAGQSNIPRICLLMSCSGAMLTRVKASPVQRFTPVNVDPPSSNAHPVLQSLLRLLFSP